MIHTRFKKLRNSKAGQNLVRLFSFKSKVFKPVNLPLFGVVPDYRFDAINEPIK